MMHPPDQLQLRRDELHLWTLLYGSQEIQITIVPDGGDGLPAVLATHSGVVLYGAALAAFPVDEDRVRLVTDGPVFVSLVRLAAQVLMTVEAGELDWPQIYELAELAQDDVAAPVAQPVPPVPPVPEVPRAFQDPFADPLDLLFFYALSFTPSARKINLHPVRRAQA